jgi:hypothetical protein
VNRRLRLGAVAAGAAALIAVGGCSSHGPSTSSAGTPAGAKAANPRVVLADAIRKTGTGTTAKVTLHVTSAGSTIAGSGAMKFASPPMGRLNLRIPQQGEVTVLTTPTAIYMHNAQLAGQLGGKAWLKMAYADLAAAGGTLGKLLKQQMTQQNQDPRQYLKLMAASNNLASVGTETVDGVSTTHLHGTVDVSKALAGPVAGEGLTAAEIAQLRKQFQSLGLSQITADIWVDSDGWPRKISQAGGAGKTKFTSVTTLSDFGVVVDVTPPPVAEVTDLGAMLRSMGQ